MTARRVFSERQPAIALAALGLVVLNNVVASAMFVAAYGFDPAAFGNPSILPDADAAVILRLGALIDMLGYLAFAPVVLYFHGRLGGAPPGGGAGVWMSVLTSCGLGFVLVGAIGAVLIASVAPWLIESGASAGAAEPLATSVRSAFGALSNSVYVGLWGTLELLLLGVWLLGVCWLVRGEGRAFAYLGIATGAGELAYSASTGLTGRTPTDLSNPLHVVVLGGAVLIAVWVLWLAVRLWRGR